MDSSSRRRLLAAAGAALCAPALLAQSSWPARPVRMVVPFPPGGSLDTVARQVAVRLQERLGQPFVIDNRAGAGGHIGAEAVARSAPDGYTYLFGATWIAISPHLQKLPYDVTRDLTGVSMISLGSFILVANPAQPFSTFQEFLAAARQQPGKLSFGSQGSGSGPHLSMAWLMNLSGINLLHVPYKGSAANLQAALTGEVNVTFEPAITVLPHLRAGKLKALATGSPKPLPSMAGVPPIAQTFPGFDTDGWQALFAPAGTPRDILNRLSTEVTRVMALPEVVTVLENLGTVPLASPPEEVDALVRRQLDTWGRVIRQNNIKADA